MSEFPPDPIRLRFDFAARVERAFSELIHEPWGTDSLLRWEPAVDLYDLADAFLLIADVPGMQPTDVHVSVRNRDVTLSGERKQTSLVTSVRGLRLERRQGAFARTIELPEQIDPGSVQILSEAGTIQVWIRKDMGSKGMGSGRSADKDEQ